MSVLAVTYTVFFIFWGMASNALPGTFNFADGSVAGPYRFTAQQSRNIRRHSGGERGSALDQDRKRRWSQSILPVDWESTRVSRCGGPITINDWDTVCTPGGVEAKATILAGKLKVRTAPLIWSPVKTQGERVSQILANDFLQRNPTFPIVDYSEVHRKSYAGTDHYQVDSDSCGSATTCDYDTTNTTNMTPVSVAYVADTVNYTWKAPVQNVVVDHEYAAGNTGSVVSTTGAPVINQGVGHQKFVPPPVVPTVYVSPTGQMFNVRPKPPTFAEVKKFQFVQSQQQAKLATQPSAQYSQGGPSVPRRATPFNPRYAQTFTRIAGDPGALHKVYTSTSLGATMTPPVTMARLNTSTVLVSSGYATMPSSVINAAGSLKSQVYDVGGNAPKFSHATLNGSYVVPVTGRENTVGGQQVPAWRTGLAEISVNLDKSLREGETSLLSLTVKMQQAQLKCQEAEERRIKEEIQRLARSIQVGDGDLTRAKKKDFLDLPSYSAGMVDEILMDDTTGRGDIPMNVPGTNRKNQSVRFMDTDRDTESSPVPQASDVPSTPRMRDSVDRLSAMSPILDNTSLAQSQDARIITPGEGSHDMRMDGNSARNPRNEDAGAELQRLLDNSVPAMNARNEAKTEEMRLATLLAGAGGGGDGDGDDNDKKDKKDDKKKRNKRKSINPAMDLEVSDGESISLPMSGYDDSKSDKSRKPRARPLPLWNGKDWPRFAERALRIQKSQNWDDDFLISEILMACDDALGGTCDIASDLPLDEFLEQMSYNFHDKSPADYRNEYRHLHQKQGQTPVSYALELVRKGVRAKGREFKTSPGMLRDALDHFISTLIDPALTQWVWIQSPTSLMEAARLAMKWLEGQAMHGRASMPTERLGPAVATINTSEKQDMDGGKVGNELSFVQNTAPGQGGGRPAFNNVVPQVGNRIPDTTGGSGNSPQEGRALGDSSGFSGSCHFCRELGHMKRDCEAWKAEKIKRKANQNAQRFVGRVQQVGPGQPQQYASAVPYNGQGYYQPNFQPRYVSPTGFYGQPMYRPQQFVQRPQFVQGTPRFVQRPLMPFAQRPVQNVRVPQQQFVQRPQQQFVPKPSYWVPRGNTYQTNAVQVVDEAGVPVVDVAAMAMVEPEVADSGLVPVCYEQLEAVEFEAAGYTAAENITADVAGK